MFSVRNVGQVISDTFRIDTNPNIIFYFYLPLKCQILYLADSIHKHIPLGLVQTPYVFYTMCVPRMVNIVLFRIIFHRV